MNTFVRIEDGVVMERYETELNDITGLFNASLTWLNVTAISPMPDQNWTYDGKVFTAPASPSV